MNQSGCSECGSVGKLNRYKRSGPPLCMKHYLQMRAHGRILERTKYTPNEFVEKGSVVEIVLYKNEHIEQARALIDKEDLPYVRAAKWHVARRKNKLYVETIKNKQQTFLHQFLLGKKHGLVIDHINGNTLDCRRINLRHVTQNVNVLNRKTGRAASGYMGVSFRADRGKWQAKIIRGKRTTTKLCTSKEEAIRVRKDMEKEHFGVTSEEALVAVVS